MMLSPIPIAETITGVLVSVPPLARTASNAHCERKRSNPPSIYKERPLAFIDIHSYGNARDVSGWHTIAEVAADAIALADPSGCSEFHLAGHSMGGRQRRT
jgi:pimeloyl-ACP methyl ester carboxylesterase